MSTVSRIQEAGDGYFERTVREMAVARAEHERMRRVGMHVVSYEVCDIPNGKLLRAERVDGTLLEGLPEPARRREYGALALGWHCYYTDAERAGASHIISDADSSQFMYDTTARDSQPRTYLVDIDPAVINLKNAKIDPEGTDGQLLNEAMHGWAFPSQAQAQSAWLTGGGQ